MNLARTLARVALADPRRPALYEGSRLLRDYGALASRAARLAAAFAAGGLLPGDRIALFMRNHPAYLELLYGAWWAGLAVVPMNAKLHLREAQWILEHAQARWAFMTPDVGAGLQAPERTIDATGADYEGLFALPAAPLTERGPHDLAWLFYTSGTTGKPKGVMLTHRNLMTMGLTYFVDVDPVDPRDAIVYGPPMSHGAGLYAIPHVMAGARHVVPASGGFDPAEVFELSRTLGRLTMFAAPTVVKRLVDHAQETQADCAGFKTIVYGGAPMYAADIERAMRVMGPRFVQ
ncbi:MAG TPA: AMP-binding protein, partial [Ramlibacter sp.]